MPSATTNITARESWESIRDRKLSQRDSLLSSTGWLLPFSSPLVKPVSQGGLIDVTSVPAQSGILTSQELEITETDGHVLVGKLKRGEVKSVDVVRAFCKRATIAHQLVSAQSLPMNT
jgi:amidase